MNFLYIFIFVIILLFVHGLIFKMKNNQIIYTIEKFKQSNNQIKKKMSGSWTSDTSNIIDIDSNNYLVTNIININTFNNIIKYRDQVLIIKSISDKLIYADNENLKINIYFSNKYLDKPIFSRSIKVASLYDFTNKKAYYIFKLNNNGKLSEKVNTCFQGNIAELGFVRMYTRLKLGFLFMPILYLHSRFVQRDSISFQCYNLQAHWVIPKQNKQ